MLHLNASIPSSQLVKQALAVLGSGDIEGYVACFDTNATFVSHCAEPLPFGGQYRGYQALLEHYRDRTRQLPFKGMVWNISLTCGDDFLIYGLAEYCLPSSQKISVGTMALWYTVRNESISELNHYSDSSVLHRLLTETGEKREEPQAEQFSTAVKESLGLIGELAGPPREDFSQLLELYQPGIPLRRSDLADFLDPQVEWYSPTTRSLPLAAHASGIDEVVRHFQIFDDAFEVLEFIPGRVAHAEDTLVVRAELKLGCRACHKEIQVPGFQALTMRDGRIVRGFEVSDTLRIDQCLLGSQLPTLSK